MRRKARIAARNVRRDGMDALKTDEKKGVFGEDERKRHEGEVQKLTDATIADMDAAASGQGKGNPRQVTPAPASAQAPAARGGGCRAMSRSSWTATGAGRRSAMLPRVAGHRAGAEAVRRTIRAAAEMGIEALTMYAFSSENWRRPAGEISDLMGLLRHYLRASSTSRAQRHPLSRLIGDYRAFDPDLVDDARRRVERTARQSPA